MCVGVGYRRYSASPQRTFITEHGLCQDKSSSQRFLSVVLGYLAFNLIQSPAFFLNARSDILLIVSPLSIMSTYQVNISNLYLFSFQSGGNCLVKLEPKFPEQIFLYNFSESGRILQWTDHTLYMYQ